MTSAATATPSIPATAATSDPSLRASRKKRAGTEDKSYLKAPKIIPGGAVICISRLPHGFFESELRAYLCQFGDITRLRLSRNPRTGASRHYAFVEFKHAEVARIVVETMHNYLLMGHLLQCTLVPEEKIHAELWKGANRKFVHVPWRRMEMKRYNAQEKKDQKPVNLARCKEILREKGIAYDVDEVIISEELSLH
jgi:nucleolar protein 15